MVKYISRYPIITNRFLYIVLVNAFVYWFGSIYLNATSFQQALDTFQFSYIIDLIKHIFRNIALYFIICFLCAMVLKESLYRMLECLLVIISFVVAGINIFLMINFYTWINPIFISIFLSMNANEAKEFLHTYALASNVIIILAIFAVVSIIANYKIFFKYIYRPMANFGIFLVSIALFAIGFTHGVAYIVGRFIYWNASAHVAYNLYEVIMEKNEIMNSYAKISKDMQEYLDSKTNNNGGGGV